MGRYSGSVGVITSIESPAGSGIWIESPTEYEVFGDILTNNQYANPGENANPDVRMNYRLSLIPWTYDLNALLSIRYATYAGKRWSVTTVEVAFPRITIGLGEVYNGPTPVVAPTP